tara:strand:+ start:3131 stop:3373 length:243 start_codon:yes stop_codon:yes gene_type:complete
MDKSRNYLKWNFPIAQAAIKKIKSVYKEKGLLEAIAYVVVIVIGFKVVVINGIIYSINYLFLTNIKYGPVLYYIFGIKLI